MKFVNLMGSARWGVARPTLYALHLNESPAQPTLYPPQGRVPSLLAMHWGNVNCPNNRRSPQRFASWCASCTQIKAVLPSRSSPVRKIIKVKTQLSWYRIVNDAPKQLCWKTHIIYVDFVTRRVLDEK